MQIRKLASSNLQPSGSTRRLVRFVSVGTAACMLFSTAPALAASAAESSPATTTRSLPAPGLFGSQDPTYNGVFRQSLAILALKAAGAHVNQQATAWLLAQQCTDGSFVAFRESVSVPCGQPDANNYSGPDSNSTAIAAAALAVSGKRANARSAIRWLVTRQNSDGGFAYYPAPGSTSDANSTGLVALALSALGRKPAKTRVGSGSSVMDYLHTVQQSCDVTGDGRAAMRFTAGPESSTNNLASAQAGLGLTPLVRGNGRIASVTKPAGKLRPAVPVFVCPKPRHIAQTTTRNALLGYLARTMLANGGAIPDTFSPGKADVGSTAASIISLATAGFGRAAVRQGVGVLRLNASTYLQSNGPFGLADDAGSLANYILVAKATKKNPRTMFGTNLIARLNATRQA